MHCTKRKQFVEGGMEDLLCGRQIKRKWNEKDGDVIEVCDGVFDA